ncbi:hypothetical protein [Pontibacter harenae]|uniref:hypothetical protein n=1 Tax=Pontibacter harenae TaxID=2894083 RepID=UPI001E43B9E3|nr:hypothetical protein [Pontibacter harenae]MCC9166554.1 hypothetical protein [Pontibacter harenae]
MGGVVHAAHLADGTLAERVVAPLRGYLHCMETILADAAYEKVFMEWVSENLLGVDFKISSKPPGTEGFVPVKWRWVTERAFGMFSFFRRLDKDHEKTPESAQSWVLWHSCQITLNIMNRKNRWLNFNHDLTDKLSASRIFPFYLFPIVCGLVSLALVPGKVAALLFLLFRRE